MLLSQAYFLPKVLATNDGLGFRLIWFGGQLLSQGVSPYADAFDSAYTLRPSDRGLEAIFGSTRLLGILSNPLSSLPFESSLLVWHFMIYSMLIAAAAVFASLPLRRLERFSTYSRFAIALSTLSISQAIPFAIALGRTSFHQPRIDGRFSRQPTGNDCAWTRMLLSRTRRTILSA
jgi:hypothetical protein